MIRESELLACKECGVVFWSKARRVVKERKLKGHYCLVHFKPIEKNWLFFRVSANNHNNYHDKEN
jgi:hypothetical protein